MTVWRVEAPNGYGPYQIWISWQDGAHEAPERPSPETCDLMRVGWLGRGQGDWRFGFKSLEDLHKWFRPHELEALEGHCRIVSYEVPEDRVIFGRTQIAFDRRAAAMQEAA